MHTLDGGRIGIAAQALGIAEGALEATIAYVKERKQFGRTIAQQQNTQFQLADMAAKIDAAFFSASAMISAAVFSAVVTPSFLILSINSCNWISISTPLKSVKNL